MRVSALHPEMACPEMAQRRASCSAGNRVTATSGQTQALLSQIAWASKAVYRRLVAGATHAVLLPAGSCWRCYVRSVHPLVVAGAGACYPPATPSSLPQGQQSRAGQARRQPAHTCTSGIRRPDGRHTCGWQILGSLVSCVLLLVLQPNCLPLAGTGEQPEKGKRT